MSETGRESDLAERVAYLEGVIEQQNKRIKRLESRVLKLESRR